MTRRSFIGTGRPGHWGWLAPPPSAGRVPVAVFPGVRAGTYDPLDPEAVPLAIVAVTGGRVSEVDLRPRGARPTA